MAVFRLLKPLILLVSMASSPVFAQPELAHDGDAQYQLSLKFAHEGRLSEALAILDKLTTDFPDNKPYLYDYIAVLGWSEQDVEVIRLASIIDFTDTPSYVLEVIGKSARNKRNFSLALNAYSHSLARDPNGIQSLAGFAYALAESGNIESAQKFLNKQIEEHPTVITLLRTRAYIEKLLPDYFALLSTYEKMLEISQNDREALSGRAWAASWLGAAPIAYELATKHRELFTDHEFSRFQADKLGVSIRYATLSSVNPPRSIETLINARTSLIERRDQLITSKRENSEFYWQTIADLLIVSSQLDQYQDVINLYQLLVANTKNVTEYLHILAADAYLQLEQPLTAESIYRAIIDKKKDYLAAYIGLFYALTEQDRYADADALMTNAKVIFSAPSVSKWLDDSQRLQIDIGLVQAKSFADQFEPAQLTLNSLLATAPANADIRSELATVYLWRGWPRRAIDDFNIALMYDQNHLTSQIGRTQAYLRINDDESAKISIDKLLEAYPYNHRIQKLNADYELRHRWDLLFESAYSKSTSPLDNTANIGIDSKLYANSFYHHFRPFIHGWYAQANLPTGQYRNLRSGLGINYRTTGWLAEVELNTRIKAPYRPGVSGTVNHQINDFWSMDGAFESESQTVPYRAQQSNIFGSHVSGGINYRWNELTNAGANSYFARFTDNNIRINGDIYGVHRLYNRYNYKLDGRLDIYGSRNRTIEASYYNPRWDLSAGASLINEHILYRNYQHSFRHRLTISASAYKQSSYSLLPVWSVRYEQQWNPAPWFELHYGASYGKPVYDGNIETNLSVFAGLEARF